MGSYKNLVNIYYGTIVAGQNYSPRDQYLQIYGEAPSHDQLPGIQKWSDIVALQWENAKPSHKIVQYIFRSYIENDNTRNMIRHAFKQSGQTHVTPYDGFDFVAQPGGHDDLAEAFSGLLGTYHGAGPAYMLAQYRRMFKQKRITKIRVWNDRGSWSVHHGNLKDLKPSMMLFVEEVPGTTLFSYSASCSHV